MRLAEGRDSRVAHVLYSIVGVINVADISEQFTQQLIRK